MAQGQPQAVIPAQPTPRVANQPLEYFLFLIHPIGKPFQINREDIALVMKELEKLPKGSIRLNLILNSPGGDVYSAYKIISALRSHVSDITAWICYWAASAATLMALGADRIVMFPLSQLGPLDKPMEHPNGQQVSALDEVRALTNIASTGAEILKTHYKAIRDNTDLGENEAMKIASDSACNNVSSLLAQLDPILIQRSFRELRISEKYATRLLNSFMWKGHPKFTEFIVDKLIWDYPAHSYAILRDEAKKDLYLKVSNSETRRRDSKKIWRHYETQNKGSAKYVKLLSRSEFDFLK